MNGSSISKKEQTASITLLTFSSQKAFDAVIADFEKQLGKMDEEKLIATKDLSGSIKQMEGSSGLMIVHVLEMGKIVSSLLDSSTKARQYLVGNPAIASKMTALDTLAALYAPPRVLIYTRDAETCISYDQPSSVFGRLGAKEILAVANDLDNKFESLVKTALATQ